jgi:hypothetical protein
VWAAYKADEVRIANHGLPKIRTDFVAYAAQEIQDKTAAEIGATLDFLNKQLLPRPDLPAKRVIISDCGQSWSACGGNAVQHEQKNRVLFAKLLNWQPPMIFYNESYSVDLKRQTGSRFRLIELKDIPGSLYKTLSELYSQQEDFVKKAKQRDGRSPSAASVAQFSENYLTQPSTQ